MEEQFWNLVCPCELLYEYLPEITSSEIHNQMGSIYIDEKSFLHGLNIFLDKLKELRVVENIL